MKTYEGFFHIFDQPLLIIQADRVIDCNPAAVRFFQKETKDSLLKPFPVLIEQYVSTYPSTTIALNGQELWNKLKQKTEELGSYAISLLEKGSSKVENSRILCKTWKFAENANAPCYFFLSLTNDSYTSTANELENLQLSSRLYTSMVELAPEIIMKYDKDGVVYYCNAKAKELTDFPAEYYIGKKVQELTVFPERLIRQWKRILAAAYTTGETQRDEFLMPNGTWIDCICKPEKGENGEVCEVAVYSRDISDQVKMKQELELYRDRLEELVRERTIDLKKNKQILADALDLTMAGVWEYNFSTKKFLVDKRVCLIYGFPFDEGEVKQQVPLNALVELLHPDEVNEWLKSVKRLRESKVGELILGTGHRILRKDGVVRYVYSNIRVLRHKETGDRIIRGVVNDITHLKEAEKEKERLIQIINATPDIVAIASPNKELQYLNQAGKSFFGYFEDLPVREVVELQKKIADSLLQDHIIEVAKQQGHWAGENVLTASNGEQILVSQVIVAHSEYGHLRSLSTIVRDISSQKRIETDLLYKKRELDTFIYKASHDLKGPIASMLGLNNLISQDVEDPRAKEYFDLYQKEVNKMHHIILSLIELTEIKEKEVLCKRIDFESLLDKVKGELNDGTADKIKFTYSIALEQPYFSDPDLFYVLLYNVLHNAVTYSRKEVAPKLEVLIQGSAKELKISVSDNGQGIVPQIQDKIFQMFYRGSEDSQGHGLGLYMVQNVVDKLRGQIDLKSKVGKGTIFTFRFPYIHSLEKCTKTNR